MNRRPMPPAVEAFVSTVRDLFEQGLSDDQVWTQACDPFKDMLRDPDVREHAKSWPTSPVRLGPEGKGGGANAFECCPAIRA